MNKKLSMLMMILGLIALSYGSSIAAELDGDGNEIIGPGTRSYQVDFDRITKGLYFDGSDYYYILEQGIPATGYLLNLHGDKYYFGDDGKMVKDQIVEHESEKYYFDSNGIMQKNAWITHQVTDSDGTVESETYYFGPTGRAYRAVDRDNGIMIKNIDGTRYGFDENGVRFEGYISKDGSRIDYQEDEAISDILYYFDPEENYAVASGFVSYNGKYPENYEENEELYLYFDEKTGRKVYSLQPGDYIGRVIEGERYLFDYNGIRQKKWNQKATTSTPRYYNEDYEGFLTKGWFLAVPSENSVEEENKKAHDAGEEKWFYAASDGKIIRNVIRKIGNHYYAFDKDGVMQADRLVVVNGNQFIKSYNVDEVKKKQMICGYNDIDGSGNHIGILEDGQKWMYFMEPEEESKEGAMCPLNRNVVISLADEDVTFFANDKGGYGQYKTNEPVNRNGKLYQNGVLLKPDADVKYGVVRVSIDSTTGNENYAIVNSTGKLQLSPGAYKLEESLYMLVGSSDNASEYRGTYNLNKCRLTNAGWQYDAGDGVTVTCPFNDLSSIADMLKEDSTLYINFNELKKTP